MQCIKCIGMQMDLKGLVRHSDKTNRRYNTDQTTFRKTFLQLKIFVFNPHFTFCSHVSNEITYQNQYAIITEISCSDEPLGFRLPLRSRHFLSLNLHHFHKNIRSWVENECWCPRTDSISNGNLTYKISISPETVFKYMGNKFLDLIADSSSD